MHPSRRIGAAIAVVALTLGCGGEPDTGDVSGTVTYDGKAVDDGAITFYPAAGPTAGGTIKDGKYTATKVPVGTSKVVVSGSKVTGKKKMYDTPNSPEMPVTSEYLPPKYSSKD